MSGRRDPPHENDGNEPPSLPTSARGPAGRDVYREYFERSADAFLIIEGDHFVDCNQATVNMLRYRSREEFLQTHPSELSPEYQPDGQQSYSKANEMIAIAFEKGSHRFEWNHRRADGEVFPVEVLLTAVRRDDVPLLHVVWRDLTDRRRLENDLYQAQKMEALGRLTGGIAHDFNNLLVAIIGHAELLEMDLEDRPELLLNVLEIKKAGDRAADLVRQLLAFGRRQVMRPEVLDLNEAVEDLRSIVERLVGQQVEVRLDLTSEPLWIKVDPGQISQVILNLAANARDAMPGGGRLYLGTGVSTGGPHAADEPVTPASRPFAVLTATDTGSGIEPAHLARIFDPFFTTKEHGRGTGLGLATVYGIVRQSGGEISVSNEPRGGAEFRILLPCIEASRDMAGQREAGAESRAIETILLVEDNPVVVRLVCNMLERSGYTVFAAPDGQAALDLVAERELDVDVLLTDVMMPGMNGPELARRMGRDHPKLKVLFTSGYEPEVLEAQGVPLENAAFIAKPFNSRELTSRLRSFLDGT